MSHTDKILQFFNAVGALEKQMNRIRLLYMQQEGLRGSDLNVLIALYSSEEGLNPEGLIQITRTDKAQISRALRELCAGGWIEKEDTSQYRARYRLSPKGKERMEYLARECEHIFEGAHACIQMEQWEAFYQFSNQLSARLEEMIQEKKQALNAHADTEPSRRTEKGKMKNA